VIGLVIEGERGLRRQHRGCDAERLEHQISPVLSGFCVTLS
jgi:hypothetical protein